MKLALIGYGKMGKTVERIAQGRGHSVIAKIDPLIGSSNTAAQTLLQEVDVCIDFSDPKALKSHIDLCALSKKPLVIGTTGWYASLDQIKAQVEKAGIGVLYSPNFSLGVNLFLQIIKEASKLFEPFESYDVAGFEMHHNQKQDSPSGTAQAIASEILKNFRRKKKALFECVNRKVEAEELQLTTLRVGHVPGFHEVIFDSPHDSITLTHEARNRDGFAEGSLIAAEWLRGKVGFFSMDDLLKTFR